MIRKKIFNKGTKKDKDRINKMVIYKKRIYKEKKGAPLGIKKAMYLKGGTVSPFI